jgi:hypothetical protein
LKEFGLNLKRKDCFKKEFEKEKKEKAYLPTFPAQRPIGLLPAPARTASFLFLLFSSR